MQGGSSVGQFPHFVLSTLRVSGRHQRISLCIVNDLKAFMSASMQRRSSVGQLPCFDICMLRVLDVHWHIPPANCCIANAVLAMQQF